ncbi:hypothetical protein [Variovorax paradoxus]|uniref:hypothetical protein n=1 Tax=Variovorax paradoxus TaxID=34073 RepID=UPI0029C895F7|nr:hypothetical protein RZE77_12405 [Variovorax paradoxus]
MGVACSGHCNGLLAQAKILLERTESGDTYAAAEADALLLLLLLGPEEWATVVSSISKEVGAARKREHRYSRVRGQASKPAA